MTEGDIWNYNLATPNERGLPHDAAQHQVAAEIEAILRKRPIALTCEEAVSYGQLPEEYGYILTWDKSTLSRKNVASYVRRDVGVVRSDYLDQHTTWPRTEHGGTHEARSFLVQRLGNGWQLVTCHQAPKNAKTVTLAQHEGVQALTRAMGSWTRHPVLHPWASKRPRIVVGDFNTVPGPNTPEALATAIQGRVVNTRHILTGVVRNLEIRDVSYPKDVDGIRLHSDHGCALRFTVSG